MDGRAVPRAALSAALSAGRNLPAAGTVAVRHLARGTRHVGTLPQPWRTPAYLAAVSALERGELLEAERLADRAGPAGAVLRELVAGEIALVTPRLPAGSPDRTPRRAVARRADTVLHLVTNSLPETVAGYTIRTQGITKAQRDAGLDVHVATRIGFPVTKGHLTAGPSVSVDGIAHHRLLPARLPLRADTALAADIEQTARLVEALRPAVLHAHSNHVNAQVALALRARFAIPVVYEVRGFLEETWRSRSIDPWAGSADAYRLTRAAETQCMRAADAVVTLSEAMRSQIVARGVDPDRVSVVPNCVDGSMVDLPDHPAPPGPDRPVTVGTVGTLNGYEGIDVLVEAVARLRRSGHDVHLRVVGDGPERIALEKQAADAGIADASTFTGRVPHDQVVDEHRAIDVFCVPRHDLPVTRLVPPLKPIEAMALGRPVVVSDLPPLREIVLPADRADRERGLVVPPGDAAALADALSLLALDPARRLRLGTHAHDWVARTRTWAAATDTYQQLYTRIQGENP